MSALPIRQGEPRPSAARRDARTGEPDVGRFGIDRISARAAFQEAITDGALLVDNRPADVRAAYGEIAPWMGPLVIGADSLERLLDPRSEQRIPRAAYDLRVIIVGQEGYTSALAAHSLQQLGVVRATDVSGGFVEWRAAGLPIIGPRPI
jgi:rhodanese-related sulfurtransferase